MHLLNFIVKLLLLGNVDDASPSILVKSCNFGEIYAFNNATCDVEIYNESNTVILISMIETSFPKDNVNVKSLSVGPKSTGYISVTANLDNVVGISKHPIHFHVSGTQAGDFRAVAQGFVLSALKDAQPQLNFGVVNSDRGANEQHISFEGVDVESLNITGVVDKPDWVTVSIDQDRHGFLVGIPSNTSWGVKSDFVKVAIDSPNQKAASVRVQADIRGNIIPSADPIELGLLRKGNRNDFQFRLTSSEKKLVVVSHTEVAGFKGDIRLTECIPASKDCKLAKLSVSDDQELGFLEGKILLSFEGFTERLEIPVNGWMVEKNLQIKDVKESDLKPHLNNEGATLDRTSHDVGAEINAAVQKQEELSPPGIGPLLKWSVSNTGQIHGFQIFRATSENGPFLLQNKETVLADVETATSSYSYRDNTAKSGKTYWYYIGLVYSDGHKQQLTGPQKVVAK